MECKLESDMANVNNEEFRGLGVKVDPSWSAEQMAQESELNWKTAIRPLWIEGSHGGFKASAYKSLVRSDDGTELSVATATYKPTHNPQIIDCFKSMADAGEMVIEKLGSLDQGRRIFASVKFGDSFHVSQLSNTGRLIFGSNEKGNESLDTVHLMGIMGSGHVPGISFTFRGRARRKVCTNGACISRSGGSFFSLRHVKDFDAEAQKRLRETVKAIRREFLQYQEHAEKLNTSYWNDDITRAFCCELLAPSYFKAALERELGTGVRPSLVEASRQFSLDQVLQASTRYLASEAFENLNGDKVKISRPAKRVLELVNSQPGADKSGTGWQAYNAATYYVDHVAGRGESTAVESGEFGQGATLKQSALDLALAYTEAIRVN